MASGPRRSSAVFPPQGWDRHRRFRRMTRSARHQPLREWPRSSTHRSIHHPRSGRWHLRPATAARDSPRKLRAAHRFERRLEIGIPGVGAPRFRPGLRGGRDPRSNRRSLRWRSRRIRTVNFRRETNPGRRVWPAKIAADCWISVRGRKPTGQLFWTPLVGSIAEPLCHQVIFWMTV